MVLTADGVETLETMAEATRSRSYQCLASPVEFRPLRRPSFLMVDERRPLRPGLEKSRDHRAHRERTGGSVPMLRTSSAKIEASEAP